MKIKRLVISQKNRFIILYLTPVLFTYGVFFIYPVVSSFIMSLYKWSGFSRNRTFIGIQNFTRMFNDDIIYSATKHNLYLLFWVTFFTFSISLFFAVIITRKKYRESSFFKTIFFLPYVLSMAIVSILWMFIYNPSFGLLNTFLRSIKMESLAMLWLGDRKVIMGALAAPLVWFNVGFFMILFISAILSIDNDLFEAAEIDGLGEVKKFVYIIIPSIWEFIRISLIFFIVTAFNYSFELIYVITKGGPNRASEILTTYLYEKAFVISDFGYASAIGVFIFILITLIITSMLILTGIKKRSYH